MRIKMKWTESRCRHLPFIASLRKNAPYFPPSLSTITTISRSTTSPQEKDESHGSGRETPPNPRVNPRASDVSSIPTGQKGTHTILLNPKKLDFPLPPFLPKVSLPPSLPSFLPSFVRGACGVGRWALEARNDLPEGFAARSDLREGREGIAGALMNDDISSCWGGE